MKSIIFALLVSVVAVNGFDFSLNWTSLKVTWGLKPLWAFDKLPRSLDENTDFDKKDDLCSNGGKFLGQRYWYKQDSAMYLLYDKNGIIAGIQTATPKDKLNPAGNLANYYIDDGDYWTLTAYFVDPSTICTQGRTKADLDQGTGTGLWLQVGPDPVKNSVKIPLSEAEVKQTKWGSGKCFPSMGQHYWYNVSKDMDCNDYMPNCLLYNKGQLTGFCFAKNANLMSDRYDFPAPTNKVVNKFLDPVPDCFFKDPSYATLSTLHVYFTDKPQFTSWC